MKRTFGKRCFSMLLAAAVALGGLTLPPAKAGQAAAAEKQEETREVNFNREWKFKLGDVSGAEQKNYNDASWETVTIPHDFSITQDFSNAYEAESGFLPGGTGWYRKTAVLPAAYAGKTMLLNFDGVYNHAYVYVNGTKLGEHHYGYTDFTFDVTKLLICDGRTENVIAVKAVNEFPSSRWYSGSGIYRDVTLLVTDAVHVAQNGTYVTTPRLESQKDGNVTVNVETTVQNDGSSQVNAEVRTTILDADDRAVSSVVSQNVQIGAGGTVKLTAEPTVSRPELWSCDNPALYHVKTEVLVGGTLRDTYMTEFGFRYFAFDANTGFSLNGEKIKIKGVCMHHDQGALGAAAYDDAIYRQVRILKEMGCNAIRTSHNPASKELLSICNQLGMLVQEEFFDGWSSAKNGNYKDFSVYFNTRMTADNGVLGGSTEKTWAQFTMESAMYRDRNEPCIFMWSLGNELETGTTTGVAGFENIAGDLIRWAKACDDTRPLTAGDNTGSFNDSHFYTKINQQIYASGGVVGVNYSSNNYAAEHAAKPAWPLIASETASPSNSRGIYSTTEKIAESGNYQCTAYDTLCVGWGDTARSAWYKIITKDYMSGEFIWTGFDYIGEPTPWNGTGTGSASSDRKAIPNSSFFGVIDTAGFPKDSYYFYTSQWREHDTTLHLVPGTWNQNELALSGGMVPVYLYSNAAKVELYLNDSKIGTAVRTENRTGAGFTYGTYRNTSNNTTVCAAVSTSGHESLSAQFKVRYAAGTLSAKAYDASGRLIRDTLGTSSVKTNSDSGSKVKLTAEKTELQADGSSLCYISADVLDGSGQFAAGADNSIRFTLTGNGTIVGVDNGNPSAVDKFQAKSVLTNQTNANIKAFSGKALVIVRSTAQAGGFTLRADATGLTGDSVNVATVGGDGTAAYLKDYELETSYIVEMGTAPVFQTQVQGTMSDGTTVIGSVAWDSIGAEIYGAPGDYTVHGVLTIAGQQIPVTASLRVKAEIAAILNYSGATAAGSAPQLPAVLAGVLPDGQIFDGAYPVTWESVSGSAWSHAGDIVTVNGTADADGRQMPVTARIRVAEGMQTASRNVAPDCKTLTESCANQSDNLQAIIDGISDDLTGTDARWTNYNERLLNSDAAITLTWDTMQKLEKVKLYFFTDGYSAALPERVQFAVSENGIDYRTVEVSAPDTIASVSTFTFDSVQNVKGLRVTLTEQAGHCVGLLECETYTAAYSYEIHDTALLDTLTVNGHTVDGFVSGVYNSKGYTAAAADAENAVTAAVGLDNAAVTILPVSKEHVVKVIVRAEDQSVTNTYMIRLNEGEPDKADQALLDRLAQTVDDAKTINRADYTEASVKKLEDALQRAEALCQDKGALKTDVESAIAELEKAVGELEKKPEPDPDPDPKPDPDPEPKPDPDPDPDPQPDPELPGKELLAQFDVLIAEADQEEENLYTAETWKIFAEALKEAKRVQALGTLTKAEVEEALNKLKEASGNLEKKKTLGELTPPAPDDGQTPPAPDNGQIPPVSGKELPAAGSVHVCGQGQYEVTKSAQTGGTVTYLRPTKKTFRKIKIPASVQIEGVMFKVTAIAAKAMKNNKKLTQVTVGKNVTSIGASAFAGAKKLKKIAVKSKVLKSVGRKAFKGIHAKCKIKVPKKKLKAYKKLMKKKGQKAGVKITK